MNKTISVMLFKREDYSRQTLEAIGNSKGIEGWTVNVYCDNPGHDRLFKLAKSFSFVNDVYLAPNRRGLKAANQWALAMQFKKYKSDLNLHVEDDILIGPDALHFVEACYPEIKDDVGSVTLVGYVYDDPKPSSLEGFRSVFKHDWFNCGWGWATTKKFYFSQFINAKDIGDVNSWAKNILNHYQEYGFKELRSYTRRSKNIGRKGNTNWVRKSDLGGSQGKSYQALLNRDVEEYLNCYDVGDDWTGGNEEPVWDVDFSRLTK